MNISKIISRLTRKYGTRDPFELAACLNIAILYEELGSINGYYNKPLRMKQIHINHDLDRNQQRFTCAHELGHAVLHPNSNTPFLRSSTFLSVGKMEIEANRFAAELLIPDEIILENWQFTTEQLARLTGYSEELIKLRLHWIM